jgi:type I restriction enzyme S subunit
LKIKALFTNFNFCHVQRDFIYFLLQLKNTVSQISDTISGTDPPNLSLNEIKGILLTIPSEKNEQTKIANFLTAVDEKITQLTQKCDLLAQYKKGVMQQIFSQQLRFKDDDGQDFPEWEETTLAQVADPKIKWSFTGGPFGSNLKAEDYTDCGVRIIQLQNIGDGVFNDGYKIYTSENKANQLQSCNIYPNEIIISKMGDPVARCCMMPINEPRYLMASDGIRLAVDNSFFNTKFIHDSINYESFRKNALEVSTGSTRRRIGLDELRGLPINYPCLEEQTKIANFLSTLDDKINHNQTQLDAVKQYKQGLLQQLFV